MQQRKVIQLALFVLTKAMMRSKLVVGTLVLIIVISSSLSIVTPIIFGVFIDLIDGGNKSPLVFWLVCYAVVSGLVRLSYDAKIVLGNRLQQAAIHSLSVDFFSSTIRKPFSYYLHHNPAQLANILQNGQTAIKMYAQVLTHVILPSTLEILIAIVALASIVDLRVASIVVAYGAAYTTIVVFSSNHTKRHHSRAQSSSIQNSKFLGNIITSIETIRLFGSTKWAESRYNTTANESLSEWNSFYRIRFSYAIALALALSVQIVVTYLFLIPDVLGQKISTGEVVMLNLIILQLARPFEMLGTSIQEFYMASTMLSPIAEHMDERASSNNDQRGCTSPTPPGNGLTFLNVAFRYEGHVVVEDFSFEATPGAITFITGRSGAGKSTIFKLALRLIQPWKGLIALGGVDVQEIDAEHLYGLVTLVPQDSILLNDSIRENITIGRTATEAELDLAVKRSGIAELVQRLPEHLDTIAGERGLRMSGGERQRIAIARALLKQPRVLLLDEASSALDEQTEREIFETLRELAQDVTIVAITHRTSVIRPQDKVIQIEGSRSGHK